VKSLGVLLIVLLASVAEAGCPNGVCAVGDTGNWSTNGANLQTAINMAVCGDLVLPKAGAIYQASGTNFRLPNKGICANAITIRPDLAGLPADGVRLSPTAYANGLARIRGVGGQGGGYLPTISVENGANHYTLIGLDISTTGDTTPANYMPDLIDIGDGQATMSQLLVTSDLVFDRLFVHPAEISSTNLVNNTAPYRTSGRGFGVSGVRITIKNSYIGGFTGYFPGSGSKIDSYGIYCVGGPGPLTITNNYIEAGFNNIFTGGGDTPSLNTATLSAGATMTQATFSNVSNLGVGDYVAFKLPGTVTFQNGSVSQWGTVKVTAISGTTVTYEAIGPTGLPQAPSTPGQAQWRGMSLNGGTSIRGNTLYKQPQWAIDFPGLGKSFIEIKQIDGAVIDGNIIDGSSVGGAAFALTARNQGGASPWMTIKNLTVSNNLVVPAAASWIAIQLVDNEKTSTPGGNVTITNNLLPFTSHQAVQTAGGDGVLIAHNTIHSNGSAPVYNTGPAALYLGQQWGLTNLIVRDNIYNFGLYGFSYNSPNGYKGAWPPNGITEQKNVVINAQGVTEPAPTWPGQMPNSYIVSSDAAVGFVNAASADAGADYHGYALAPSSTFKGGASDGTDPGVDFAALDAALASGGAGSIAAPSPPTNLRVR